MLAVDEMYQFAVEISIISWKWRLRVMQLGIQLGCFSWMTNMKRIVRSIAFFYYLFGMIQHNIKLCSIYSFFSMGPRASLLDCLMKFWRCRPFSIMHDVCNHMKKKPHIRCSTHSKLIHCLELTGYCQCISFPMFLYIVLHWYN